MALPDSEMNCSAFARAPDGFSTSCGLETENMFLLYLNSNAGSCEIGAAGPTRRFGGIWLTKEMCEEMCWEIYLAASGLAKK